MPDGFDPLHLDASHPTTETIRQFAAGRLGGDSLYWVESHISKCTACCTVLESIPDDTLAELLRSTPSTTEKPNLRLVTGYEINEELGRGGMGVVYLATQPALGRQVALKMISRGEQANPQELCRFRREGQAIAALHHPNIAQIYEVGDQAGQPYISMEYVRGATLAHFLRGGALSINDATRLIIQLADAVAHAHSRGVIHRDLKPSNILLAQSSEIQGQPEKEKRFPSPKIVDFGLAKRTGIHETATITGMLVGTPSYMSPEQAVGKNNLVVESTDVYGLGAILYETLVGRPPFQGSNPVEILEQVRTLEPVRPKFLRPELPLDLETICLKCLEKSPAQRYQSAIELLEDLNRFAEGHPILAKPSGWSKRFFKWTKRHLAITSVVGVIGFAIICLLTVSLVYNRFLSAALSATREEHTRADKNFQYAFDAVERMLERVGFNELANQPGMETVRESLLSDAVTFYSSLLAEQPADNVDARRQYCVALARLGRLQLILGHIDESRASLTSAIDMQKQLSFESPDRYEIRHELAISHINLGLLDKWSATEFQAAIDLLQPIKETYPICRRELAEAMNLFSNTLPSETGVKFHLDVLAIRRSLLQDSPQDPHLRNGLGQTLHNLGHTHYRIGQNEEAVFALDEALGIFEGLVIEHPQVSDYQVSLAECTAILASLEHDSGRFARSKTMIERSTTVRELLAARFPKTPAIAENLAHSYLTHAAFLIQRHAFSEAAEKCELALQIAERLNRDYPSKEYQFLVASSLAQLATALGGDHQELKSYATFEQACKAYENLLRKDPQNTGYISEAGVSSMNFSNLLRPENPSKALVYNDRAVELLEKAYLEQPTRTDFKSFLFNAHGARAQTLEVLGRYSLAVDSWERAIELSEGQRICEIKIARGIALARASSFQMAADAAGDLMKTEDLKGDELYNLACLYGLIDKSDPGTKSRINLAFELLNRSECFEFLSRAENLQQLQVDSDLETIRSDERFQNLLEALSR